MRALGLGGSSKSSHAVKSSRLSKSDLSRLAQIALKEDDPTRLIEILDSLSTAQTKELARSVLRERAREAIEILESCEPCRNLLSGGGYDPVDLLATLRDSIGRKKKGAQMDIDASGGGGSQRDQGYETWIRFGPREFLTGLSLDGMTLRESQLQVILHELAHAAGDVIPPDGGNAEESLRNQQRITRACLPEVYERIRKEKTAARSQESEEKLSLPSQSDS